MLSFKIDELFDLTKLKKNSCPCGLQCKCVIKRRQLSIKSMVRDESVSATF